MEKNWMTKGNVMEKGNIMEWGNSMEQTGWKKEIKRFLQEEEGVGVVEVILILVVLIALVAIFKTKLTALVNKIFTTIDTQAGKI